MIDFWGTFTLSCNLFYRTTDPATLKNDPSPPDLSLETYDFICLIDPSELAGAFPVMTLYVISNVVICHISRGGGGFATFSSSVI